MDLSLVEAFVRVAEAKSFTGAARTTGLTSSGVSRAVSRLEAQTGVVLLNRSTRNVGLTTEGAAFFERCRGILADLKMAEAELLESANGPNGKLRITAPVGYGRSVLIPMMPLFQRRHPKIVVETSLSDEIVDLVDDGFDLAIRVGESIPPKLTSCRLGIARWIACASPGYLRERGLPQQPDDLIDHDCVAYFSPSSGRFHDWQFSHGDRISALKIGDIARHVVDHCDVLVDAALSGAGVVYLHNYVVERHLNSGALVRVLADFKTPVRSIHALYPAARGLSPKIGAFIDHALSSIESPATRKIVVA
ncbi:LysR substrate-binding domain-containing protein [Cupriavidus sp. CP313]